MTATIALDNGPEAVAGPEPVAESTWRRRLPWAILAVASVCFVYGERSIPIAGPSQWGLLGTASPAYGLSIALTVIAFAIAARHANIGAAVAATFAAIAVLQLPRSISTDMPMYAWTYKHLGVVDYLQHFHGLARGIDVYNGWPGLFAFTAWFSDLTGISPTDIAHWWIPCFHVVFVSTIYGVGRAWGLSPLAAVTAMFLVAVFNWVEQDYFSPQSVAMILTAAVMALLGVAREHPRVVWLVLILFAAINLTHPLTPYWLFGIICFFVLTRRIKAWWVILPLGLMLAGQLLYNLDIVKHFNFLSVDIFENTKTNVTRYGYTPVIGQRVVSYGNKIVTVALFGLAAVGLIMRWRRKQPFIELAAVAFSGVGLLVGLDYGGESAFRVYLYCLTGCCIAIAPLLLNLLQRDLKRFIVINALTLVLVTGAVMGNSGSWFAMVMPRIQVETSKAVLSQAELPAYLTAVAPTWAEKSNWKYVDYLRFSESFDTPMILSANLVKRDFSSIDDYRKLVETLNTRTDASTYLIMTDQMQVYCWYFGILPWDALPNLKRWLYRDTERWEPYYDGQGFTVFLHKVKPSGASSLANAPFEAPG